MTRPYPYFDVPRRRPGIVVARVVIVASLAAAVLVTFGAMLGAQSRPPVTALGSDAPSPTVALTAFPIASLLPSDAPTGSPGPSPSSSLTCPASPSNVAAAQVTSHGARTSKVVALTFDDGSNAANVLKILAILKRAHVNATFFPTGRSIELYPTAWKAVAAAHFPIANHTYDHPDLTTLCYAAQLAEMNRQDALVSTRLELAPLPFMRPPFEAFDLSTRIAATSAGKADVVLWDVDTLDWTGLSARAITRRAVAGANGSIVLMHTFPVNTSTALPTIIARYRARGFTFVTVGTLLGLGGPVPFR